MTRKLGIYHGPYCFSDKKHTMDIELKSGVHLNDGDIVTDDMILDCKDPIWNRLVDVLHTNRSKNNGELADAVLELFEKEGRLK